MADEMDASTTALVHVPKRGPGQPTKYTPDRIARILEYLRDGNTRRASALASGISVDTFCTWLNLYPEFSEAVTRAEAEAEAAIVRTVIKAATAGQWGAATFWLERRRHEDGGKKDRIELIHSVRELARAHNQDEDAAVRQAEVILKELRSQARA